MKPGEPTLAALVREQARVPWSRAKSLCTQGRVTVDGERWLDPAARVPEGARVEVHVGTPHMRTGPLPRKSIVHFDRNLVVVDKPAGMLTVADVEGNKDTLADHVRTLLRRLDPAGTDAPLSVVHRLDKDTSGVMVFARTASAKRHLADLFEAHAVDRIYRALAHGTVQEERIESHLVLDRGDGLRGSHGEYKRSGKAPPGNARRAVTFVKPLEALRGATLVECRLETGRQHQIRIHLAERGHPVIGEQIYIRDYKSGKIAAPRLMLHAHTLGFAHPRDGAMVTFVREPPADFAAMLESLRP
jgi:23S rRNA pseudouridine1911/1915/1917 synthase